MQIVVAERGVNRNLLLAPHRSFRIENFPVVFIVAVVDDVTAEGDEGRVGLSNGLYQSLARVRICCLGILGVVEARIAISHEVERCAHLQLQLHWFGRRRCLRMRAGAGNAAEKENYDRQILKKFHSLTCNQRPTTNTSNWPASAVDRKS